MAARPLAGPNRLHVYEAKNLGEDYLLHKFMEQLPASRHGGVSTNLWKTHCSTLWSAKAGSTLHKKEVEIPRP
jgi:hypothetical protein